MLVEMVIWAARHENTDALPATVKAMESERGKFIAGIRARHAAGTVSGS